MGTMTGVPLAPVDLRIEHELEPLDVDTPIPLFSWKLISAGRDIRQAAYQIWVASSLDLLESDKPDVWDSGKIEDPESSRILYTGFPLAPKSDFYWKVRIWDSFNRVSAFSDPAFFSTAFFSNASWTAPWITWEAPSEAVSSAEEGSAEGEPDRTRSIMLFKAFRIVRPVRRARLYVSGLGAYRLDINGQLIGGEWFAPGWTDYRKEVQYQVFDVSEYLKDGPNVLGLTLGNMWWGSGLGWKGGEIYQDGKLMARLQLELTLTDGSTRVIQTDDSWRGALSAVVRNSLYHGETWDASLHPTEWNSPLFDDQDWTLARILDPQPSVRMVARQCAPIRCTQEIQPVSMHESEQGSFIFDFGQNMAGVVRLRAKGQKGTRIQLRFSELLHPDGSLNTENLRSARATDVFILAGTGETEEWAPMFTYHGFRYVEVSGYPGTPERDALVGLVLHTDAAGIGGFTCSSRTMTGIQQNIEWGLRSNMHSVPTDCPQRDERLGWTGDAQVIAPTACWNRDVLRFFSKWLRDLRLTQTPEGWVRDVAPAAVVEGPAAPGWGDAIAIVPWEVFRYTGDRRILIDNFEAIRNWVEYMRWKADGLLYKREGYGDWVAPEASPKEPLGTAFFYRSTWILSKIAEILGETDDVWEYTELSTQIAAAYNEAYLDRSTGWYEGKTQTGQVLPLAFGICPEDQRRQVADRLVEDIRAHGDHLTTGFLGTAELLPVLTQAGYLDVAYRLAQQTTYPSWGYMLEHGATTIWELWNSDTQGPEMNSRNHFALGSVGRWFFETVAGLNPILPGFRKFRVRPRPGGGVHWAHAWHDSAYGRLSSHWRQTAPDTIALDVMVPPNTEAEVWLPFAGDARRVYESGALILLEGMESPGLSERGLTWLATRGGAEVFRAGSGFYQFSVSR